MPAIRVPLRAAVLSTFLSNEWTRHGPPDLANTTVSALEPTTTKKTSALLRRSSKSDPATKRRTPAISGKWRKTGLWLNHRMGKNGDRSSFGGYKDDCSPCRPTAGSRAPVKRGRLIRLPPERQTDGPIRVEAPRRTNARRGALNAPQLLPPIPTFPAPLPREKPRGLFGRAPLSSG